MKTLLFAFIFLAACSTTSADQPDPAADATEADATTADAPAADEPAVETERGLAPAPFSSEEIRAGNPIGRRDVFRVEAAGQEPLLRATVVVDADEEEATLQFVMIDREGKIAGEAGEKTTTWDELRQHASYPARHTTVEDERIEIPAGTFDTKHYRVTSSTEEGAARVVDAWFAKELPGPPVRVVETVDGAPIYLMVLVRHEGPESESTPAE